MTTYYVSQTGSNTSPWDTEAKGKTTVAAGIGLLSGSDRLRIGNGIYNEAIRNTIPSGGPGSPTIIEAINARQVTLRAPSGYYTIAFTGTGTFQYIDIDGIVADGVNALSNPVYVSMDPLGSAHHITFRNGKSMRATDDGSHYGLAGMQLGKHGNVAAHHHFTVTNWESTQNPEYGFYIICRDSVLDNVDAVDNDGTGVVMYTTGGTGVDNNILRNSRIRANGNGPIILTVSLEAVLLGSGRGNMAYNNIISGNVNPASGTFHGVRAYGNSIDAMIFSNTIYGNANHAVYRETGSTGTLIYNNIGYQNGTDAIGGSGGSTNSNNLMGNPLFANAGGEDFSLLAGSPAIGTGLNLSAYFTTDFNGIVRTVPWDIGALKYGAGGLGSNLGATGPVIFASSALLKSNNLSVADIIRFGNIANINVREITAIGNI